MLGTIARLVGSIIRFLLVVVILSAIGSILLTAGLGVVGPDSGPSVETPEPLPDWPFVWEVPIDDGADIETNPQPGPEIEDEAGPPVTEDPGETTLDRDGASISSESVERRIHERVNEIRMDNDLSTIEYDDGIASIARVHSHDMAERGYFSHVNPEGEGPDDRMGSLFPSSCRAVGENLAMVGTARADDADAIAERVVTGWMESEGHRENILTDGWDREGIGVYLNDRAAFATQKFCEDR